MKCTAGPNDYHLLQRPRFVVTIFDCQGQVSNVIEGRLPYDTIEDIKEYHGEEEAKDAWWQVYLWIRRQEELQDKATPMKECPPTFSEQIEKRFPEIKQYRV